MSLHPPSSRRERILAYGLPGAGKSSIWLCLAEWIHKTNAPSHIWVLDTDSAWEAMRPEDGRIDHAVTPFSLHEYGDYKEAVKKIRENGTVDDWFVVDRGDVLWDASQEAWSVAVEGKDIDEFFLLHQSRGTSPGGDYGANWVQIKRMYRGMGVDLITRFRGHVLVCCAAEEVREKKGQFGDDADVYAKYKSVGLKPSGEKKLAHLFHTEIFMQESPSGYRMTTLKERKMFGGETRPYMKGKSVSPDFIMAYLIAIAEWRM